MGAAYGAFIIKKETDIRLLLPQTLLFMFFALQSGDLNNQYIVVNLTIPYSLQGNILTRQGFLDQQASSTTMAHGNSYNQSV
jgi:hypothetical protein